MGRGRRIFKQSVSAYVSEKVPEPSLLTASLSVVDSLLDNSFIFGLPWPRVGRYVGVGTAMGCEIVARNKVVRLALWSSHNEWNAHVSAPMAAAACATMVFA